MTDVAAPPPTAIRRAPRAHTERAREERKLGWYLCAPAVAVMLLVTAYPLVYAVWLSLQRYDLRVPGDQAFVGLRNFVTVLTSELWWRDFLATTVITVLSVGLELVLGMGLALFMHRAVFGRRTVRTSILIPYGIITVVAAFAWQFAFTPDLGFVNTWLNTDRAWLTERSTSYLVITLTEVWKTAPFMSLLLLAGLAIVPEELQEAAKVDGATAWQRFTKVTLPTMKGAVLVALLFRTLDAFRIFDTVFVQTRGANDTETVSMLGYNQLINRVNLGVGSAVSVLLFLTVVLIAILFVKGFKADLGQVRGER
ncbi:MAG TPA: sugar ABC transporter permease [Acidimicrobiales bacterium]|nr:sugar ABC transporter permease [Acidimicrobiales bacterium]